MKAHNISVSWIPDRAKQPVQADAYIVMVSMRDLGEMEGIKGLSPTLKQLRERHLFLASMHQVYALPVLENGEERTVILVGTGDKPLTAEELRIAAAQAARMALKIHASTVAWEVPGLVQHFISEQSEEIAAQAMTEGFILGIYRPKHYKSNTAVSGSYEGVKRLVLVGKGPLHSEESMRWERGIRKGRALAEATCLARDLTNIPGNMLVPEDLARAATTVAKRHGLECLVLDELQLEALGMGGLLAVGKGSVHPPRMIMLRYQGTDHWQDVIGLVGKGITFDTGGISLKKRLGMEEMISDMGGAATVLAVMDALGTLRPSVNVAMVIPTAENMPAGNAFKPGDVITTLSGRTIEVLNTDAEGRVVLADGMTYAKQLGATRLIDVATLTGAVLVTLGDVATGAVTNDETFLQEFISASRRSGEKVWPLPSYEEFGDMLKSDVADLRNSTGSKGAASTAGLFIGTFAEGTPWIHLDIAGTAYLSKERGIHSKGATGVMVRTITEWILSQQ